ncbi:MAG: hypothetical protein ACLRVT_07605 [Oscillospiraceae bacterium]
MNGILIHPHEVGEYWCSLLERSAGLCGSASWAASWRTKACRSF